mmetsp:Transcript_26283/g.57912  ORF Transcript_26283/g.57912 Transcript_26283/m.57912 type:complete len:108 (+) Transcript_26283:2-325(+)
MEWVDETLLVDGSFLVHAPQKAFVLKVHMMSGESCRVCSPVADKDNTETILQKCRKKLGIPRGKFRRNKSALCYNGDVVPSNARVATWLGISRPNVLSEYQLVLYAR